MLRIASLLLAALAFGGAMTVTGEIRFNRDELLLAENEPGLVVSLPGCAGNWQVGAPSLPIATARFVVPPGMRVLAVRIADCPVETLPGEYSIAPVQEPRTMSALATSGPTPRDPGCYGSTPWPAEPVFGPDQGSMFGYNIATVFVAPLQYVASDRRLLFRPTIGIELELGEFRGRSNGFLGPGAFAGAVKSISGA